jgi:stringent starvation protein B
VTDKPIVLTDKKPYFIRAMYEWLADNGAGRIYIMVWLEHPGVKVPPHLVAKAKTDKRNYEILNISMNAAAHLKLDNLEITCSMRFNGAPYAIVVPVDAVKAIYSPDLPNAGSMQFDVTRPVTEADHASLDMSKVTGDPPMAQDRPKDEPSDKKKPPFLSVVK